MISFFGAIEPSPLPKLCGHVQQHKTSFNQPVGCVLNIFHFKLIKWTYHIYILHRLEYKDYEVSMYSLLSTMISKMHGMNKFNTNMKLVEPRIKMFLTPKKITTSQHFIQWLRLISHLWPVDMHKSSQMQPLNSRHTPKLNAWLCFMLVIVYGPVKFTEGVVGINN